MQFVFVSDNKMVIYIVEVVLYILIIGVYYVVNLFCG